MARRRRGGRDGANIRVKILGIKTEKWILFFTFNELVIGVITFLVQKFISTERQPSGGGLSHIFWVVMYLFAFVCESKTMFSFIAVFTISSAFWDFFVFFVRFVIVLEPQNSYQPDNFILLLFSWIKMFTSFFETFVILKLGWCNGVSDDDDDEKREIKKVIRESGLDCTTCCTMEEDNEIIQYVNESVEQLRQSLVTKREETVSSLLSSIESP